MIIECNTTLLQEKERADIWREKIHAAYGSVKVDLTDHGENLQGELKSGRRAQFRFTSIRYRGQSHHRSPADIARLEHEYVTLTRPNAGALAVDFGNSTCILQPSNLYLFNHAAPYFARPHNEYGTHAIAFPASALRQRGLKLQPVHILSASTHQGKLIGALADQFADHYADWSDSEFFLLSEQMLDLVAMMFGQPASVASHSESSVRSAHRRRALEYIRANYGASGLAPAKVASACGVSLSYLHHLFQGAERSVEATIIGERLDQSKRLLMEVANAHLPIGTIAYMCGFSHPAHFSRAFRNAYRCSPRELRDAVLRSDQAIVSACAGYGQVALP